MVMQRFAKPCTSVQFRSGPPALKSQLAFVIPRTALAMAINLWLKTISVKHNIDYLQSEGTTNVMSMPAIYFKKAFNLEVECQD